MAQVYEYSPYNRPENLSAAVQEELARQKANTVWYNPVTKNFHLSMTNSLYPDYQGPVICNRDEILRMKALKAAGNVNEDAARYNIYRPEFQNGAVELYDLAEEVEAGRIPKLQAGAIITAKHYTSTPIINQIISNEQVEFTFRDYQLMSAVKKETTQFIEVPLPDEFTAYGDVTMGLNEMDTPGSLNVDYTTGTVKLKKSGVIVEVSIWFDMVSRRKDVIGDINKQIPISWEKKYNEEIASTLFTPMTNVPAGTTFDVLAASGRHTMIPQRVFQAQAIVIRNAGGTPNRLAMNSTTFEVLTTNTWMGEQGFYEQSGPSLGPGDATGGSKTHPKLPGYQITLDENLATGSIYQYDDRTTRWYNGPQRTANYEDVKGSFKGTVMEKWYGSVLWKAALAKEHTGTTT
jgi:hypothetical protein